MYENWNLKRWETLMSDARHLFMDSLHDHDGLLEIILSDYWNNKATSRFKVVFQNALVYRNFDESYRLALWRRRDELTNATDLGWTFTVSESPWVQEFRDEPVFEAFHPDTMHYVMATENDVVEVISAEQPTVERVE